MSNCGQCGGGGAGGVCTCFTANSLPATQHVDLPGVVGNYISTPDSSAVSITGDIDIRAKVALNAWAAPLVTNTIVSKWGGADNSYLFRVSLTTGRLLFNYSTDGIASIARSSTASPVVADGATLWVRVTFDVNNGAAGNDTKFYTSTDGIVWVQLGTTVTVAGTVVVFDGIAPVQIGARNTSGTSDPLAGNVYYAEIRNGIDGPVAAFFNAEIVDATGGTQVPSVVTQGGTTWTITGAQWFWEDNLTSNVTARGNGSLSHPFNFVPNHLPNPRPCGHIARTATVQTLVAVTAAAVVFNTDFHPFTGSMTDLTLTPTRLTAPVDGVYLVGGFATISNPGASNDIQVYIRKNTGEFDVIQGMQDPSGGAAIMMSVTTLLHMKAGDYIELWVYSSLGANISFNNADFSATYNCPAYLWAQWMGF